MSPPIYTPDGSEVSEIVLPDGSTASEVIGPDGNVVFEAPPDIPDSAVYRWPHSEGTGTTLSDTIGSNDGTIANGNWESGTWVDGFALNNDRVTFSTVPEIGLNSDFSIALTIQAPDPSNDRRIVEHFDGDGFGVVHDSGTLRVGAFDGSSFVDNVSGPISASTKTRVFYAWDSTTDTGRLWLNATEVTGTDQSNLSTTAGFTLGAQNNSFNPFDGLTDDLIVINQTESATTAQADYDRQPWSL